MAVSGLSAALKEQLSCSICLCVYTQPKTLPCLHSFCLPCLRELAVKTPPEIPLRCPECNHHIQLPSGVSLDTLPNSFYFKRLLELLAMQERNQTTANTCRCNRNLPPTSFCFDCGEFLCDECVNAHNFVPVLRGHRRVALHQFKDADVHEFLERPERCSVEYHVQEKLEYFCEDCKSSLCQKCVLLEHRSHQYVHINKAADRCKVEMKESVNKVKAKIPVVQAVIKKAEDSFGVTKQQIKSASREVEDQVEHFILLLKQHKQSVISELEGIEQSETSRYEAKRCDLETRLAQLKTGVEFVYAVVERNLSNEIINTHESVIKRCAELAPDNEQEPEEKKVEIKYKAFEDFVATTAKLAPGCLLATGLLDPFRSSVEGEMIEEAAVGKLAEFVVVTRDSQCKVCSYGGDCVEVAIKSSTGEVVESTVLDQKNGHYTVQFTPRNVGSCEVAVHISGQAVDGSPFGVRVNRELKALTTFGSPGSGEGQFKGPCGIAVNSKGEVAVSDCNNHRIQLFSSDGQHLRTICSQGSEKGQVLWPTGIAFDLQDRIIVADDNHRLQILTTAGQSVKTFGEKELRHPLGVCVTNEGLIAVCSQHEKRGVKLFKSNGALTRQFDNTKRRSSPFSVTFSNRKFYVSYCYDHGVSVFDSNGALLFSFDQPGHQKGQFNGVAVDNSNRVLVCDPQSHGMQVFTTEGQFLQKKGSEGTDIGQFSQPMGIAISPDGHVYVSEMRGNRVQILMFDKFGL